MRTLSYPATIEPNAEESNSDILSGHYEISYDDGYWLNYVTSRYTKRINMKPDDDINELLLMIRH